MVNMINNLKLRINLYRLNKKMKEFDMVVSEFTDSIVEYENSVNQQIDKLRKTTEVLINQSNN